MLRPLQYLAAPRKTKRTNNIAAKGTARMWIFLILAHLSPFVNIYIRGTYQQKDIIWFF